MGNLNLRQNNIKQFTTGHMISSNTEELKSSEAIADETSSLESLNINKLGMHISIKK